MTDLIAAQLRSELLAVFEDPHYRPPPLPTVALELIALSGRESTEVGAVVALLERDEMLAATVLRLVGSPLYAGRSPIRSLHAAVVRLGVQGVRNAVFEAAVNKGVFNCRDYSETVTNIARHSTLTAYITRIVCRRVGIDADLAFICGLLHDVGFAGLLLAVTHVEGKAAPPLHLLWNDIDALHEQATLLVTQRWGLPPEVVEVVGHHHHLHTGGFARTAAAVRLADHLTQHFDATVVGPLQDGTALLGDAIGSFELETALNDLGVDDATLRLILTDAERTIPEIVLL